MPSHTRNRINPPEILLISLVWIVLITAPFLFGYATDEVSWKSMIKPLEMLLPLAVIFLINRFLLVPFIFFRQKTSNYLQYILSVAALISVITIASFLFTSPIPYQSSS